MADKMLGRAKEILEGRRIYSTEERDKLQEEFSSTKGRATTAIAKASRQNNKGKN